MAGHMFYFHRAVLHLIVIYSWDYSVLQRHSIDFVVLMFLITTEFTPGVLISEDVITS